MTGAEETLKEALRAYNNLKVKSAVRWLKANPVRSALSLIHALWLLALTFIWLSQSYTYGDEFLLVQMTSGIRHIVLSGSKGKMFRTGLQTPSGRGNGNLSGSKGRRFRTGLQTPSGR
ncbi:MAG: hypothetical protein DRI57_14215 [Deltaproteobacteria bacterium]|nr:MAG: hypothetical protein DRI57_14215 [Deltaproteobacteria bacterium]